MTSRLEIENFRDASVRENVVAAFDPLCETELEQKTAKVIEADVGVGLCPQDARQHRHLNEAGPGLASARLCGGAGSSAQAARSPLVERS
jgi:hypothetical protein